LTISSKGPLIEPRGVAKEGERDRRWVHAGALDVRGEVGHLPTTRLIDNMNLTELAEACREENRWDFFFAALPWRMKGVTSSASNPVAVF
jgi:hypothetical protein